MAPHELMRDGGGELAIYRVLRSDHRKEYHATRNLARVKGMGEEVWRRQT
jgi:hypothetical protein